MNSRKLRILGKLVRVLLIPALFPVVMLANYVLTNQGRDKLALALTGGYFILFGVIATAFPRESSTLDSYYTKNGKVYRESTWPFSEQTIISKTKWAGIGFAAMGVLMLALAILKRA